MRVFRVEGLENIDEQDILYPWIWGTSFPCILFLNARRKSWGAINNDGFLPVLWLYFIPALLYCLYNNLAYVNLLNYDPATYFILLQLRVVITGVLFQVKHNYFLFYIPLSTRPWNQGFGASQISSWSAPVLSFCVKNFVVPFRVSKFCCYVPESRKCLLRSIIFNQFLPPEHNFWLISCSGTPFWSIFACFALMLRSSFERFVTPQRYCT